LPYRLFLGKKGERGYKQVGRKFKAKCIECKKEFEYVLHSWDEKAHLYCSEICECRKMKRDNELYIKKKIEDTIPKKYRNLKTDRTELLTKCMGTNLYIYGKCGTGKSIFIANLAMQYLINGYAIRWIETLEFFQKM